jgi:Ni,Fe-hydrogenase III large subunit
LAVIKGETSVPGPVGRASGVANDARSSDPVYQALGFSSITRDEGDVYARFQLRLDEVIQSFDLILAARTMTTGSPPLAPDLSGSSSATIETPRGAATLDLTVVGGDVTGADWTAPSSRLLGLVAAVTKEAEVGDALVGVASLDLSPWEVSG